MKSRLSRWSGQMEDPYEIRPAANSPRDNAANLRAEVGRRSEDAYSSPHASPLFHLPCTSCRKMFGCVAPVDVHAAAEGLMCSDTLCSSLSGTELGPTDAGSSDGPLTTSASSLEEMLSAEERRRKRSRLLHHHLRKEELLHGHQPHAIQSSDPTTPDGAGEHAAASRHHTLAHILVSSVRSSAGRYRALQPSPFSRWHPHPSDEHECTPLSLLSDDEDVDGGAEQRARQDEEATQEACAVAYSVKPADVVAHLTPLFAAPFEWLTRQQETLVMERAYRLLCSHVQEGATPFSTQPPSSGHDNAARNAPGDEDGGGGSGGDDCFRPIDVARHRVGRRGICAESPSDAHREEAGGLATLPSMSTSPPHRAERGEEGQLATTVEVLHERLLRHVAHASRCQSGAGLGAARPAAVVPVNTPQCLRCWVQRALPVLQSHVKDAMDDVTALSLCLPLSSSDLVSTAPCTSMTTTSRRERGESSPWAVWRSISPSDFFLKKGTREQALPALSDVFSGLHGEAERLAVSGPSIDVLAEGTNGVPTLELAAVHTQLTRVQQGIDDSREILCALNGQVAEHNHRWTALVRAENAWAADRQRQQEDEADNRLSATADMADSVRVLAHTPIVTWVFPISLHDERPLQPSQGRGRRASPPSKSSPAANSGFGTICGLRLGLIVPRSATSAAAAAPSPAKDKGRDEPAAPHSEPTVSPREELDRAVSVEWRCLQEMLRRQRLYTQVLLSGGAAPPASLQGSPPLATEKVSVAEVNTACGMLANVLVHLAAIHRHRFRCARFHLHGERTTIDIVEPNQTRNTPAGGAAAGPAALFGATSFPLFWPQQRAEPVAEEPGVLVISTVDFFLNEKFFAWRTFGTACDVVLGCVGELCDLLRSGLQCQRRRLQFTVAEGQDRQPPLQREGTDGATLSDPTIPAESAARAAELPIALAAPYAISGSRIDGFPFTHGTVTDAVWTVAARKVVANVKWCVEATRVLHGVVDQQGD